MPAVVRQFYCVAFLLSLEGSRPTSSLQYDYNDNYSEADYFQANTTEEEANVEEESVKTPEFVSVSKTIMVNQGDNIRLPCFVDESDSGMTWIWKKGPTILALGTRVLSNLDTRTELEQYQTGNRLVIHMAEEKDAGEYVCQVSAARTLELRHTVNIRVMPLLEAVQSLVRVKAGSPAELGCRVLKGSPEPKVSWQRKVRPLPSGSASVSGLSLTFPSTSRHHSGLYLCTADNGWGHPATAQVRLDVQHQPEVAQEQLFIHNKMGDELEITCTVHASPIARVEWLKDEELFTAAVVEKRGNRHTLLLPVSEGRAGQYTCRATNSLGSGEAVVGVGREPPPLHVLSQGQGGQEDRYLLSWEVASPAFPVEEFLVEHMSREGQQDWSSMVVASQTGTEGRFRGSAEIIELTQGTDYITRIASKLNTGEFSRFSDEFVFTTATSPELESKALEPEAKTEPEAEPEAESQPELEMIPELENEFLVDPKPAPSDAVVNPLEGSGDHSGDSGVSGDHSGDRAFKLLKEASGEDIPLEIDAQKDATDDTEGSGGRGHLSKELPIQEKSTSGGHKSQAVNLFTLSIAFMTFYSK